MNNLLKEAIEQYNKGNPNRAISFIKEFLKNNPNDLDAIYNIASIYNNLNDYKHSKPYLEKYMSLKKDDWEVLDMLADVYFSEGDYDNSIKILKNALNYVKDKDTVSSLREKIESVEDRLKFASTQQKLAFLCAKGLDNFIDDIIRELSSDYWVRKFIITNNEQIYSAVDWGDIVWLEWANEVAIVASNYENLKNKKSIVRLHRYEAFSNMPAMIKWDNINLLLFVAPHIKRTVEKRFLNISKNVEMKVLYNGIDLNKYGFTVREKGYNVAWVANINHRKNPPMMLQIISKLVDIDSRYKLHIAGALQSLEYDKYLRYLIKEMNLENNVVIYGWVDNMAKWWKDKNYALSTSIHEGHPYNIMEGMAKGIKPIIHNFEGSKKLFLEETIFNTVDQAVNLITEDKYDSLKYRKFIEDNYSLDKQINSIKNILKSLVPQDKRATSNNFLNANSVSSSKKNSMLDGNNVKQFYDDFSKKMEAQYSTPSPRHNHIFKILNNMNFENRTVLEIGCGIGILTRYLAKKAKRVHSIDISPEMISRTLENANFKNVSVEVLDITKDNINGKYDIVIAADVLEHLGNDNLANVFHKLSNVLSENGVMYINIPYGRYNKFFKKYNPSILQIVDEVIDLDFLFSISKDNNFYPIYTNLYGIDHPYQYFETILIRDEHLEHIYKKDVFKKP